ncbi:DUF1987 domain-containing protein [soil metagenome]
MKIIKLVGTEDTPEIILDKEQEVYEISGRSLPEDSSEFYQPVLAWIAEYSQEPKSTMNFVFKLEYFNTSSSKLILDILSRLEELPGITISWYFHDDDEDMEEAGKEFSELVDIPFEFKTY